MKTVNVRGVVFGEGRPKIMTSLCGSDAAGMIEQAQFAKTLPVDVLEWRIDFLDKRMTSIRLLIAVGNFVPR